MTSSSERSADLWLASPIGLVRIDLDQRITECNPAFAAMIGRAAGDVLGMHGWELFHHSSPAPNPEAVTELLTGLRPSYTAERLLAAGDGSPLPVKLDWSVTRDVGGTVEGLVCFVTDVSAQAATAAALDDARQAAEVLWDRAPVGIIEGSPDGVISRVNDAALTMLGRTREELLGSHAAALADPAYAPTISAGVAQLLEGRPYAAERRYLHADGHGVPVYLSTAVLRGADGNVTRLVGFFVDMTEAVAQRGALEQALSEVAAAKAELEHRQAFTEALLETVDVGIVSCDATGAALVRNKAQRDMLGLREHETDPQGAFELRTEDGTVLDRQHYPLACALRGEKVQDLELRQGPTGGPLRDILVRGQQLLTPDGTVTGAVIAVTDVTAARRASRELAEERTRLAEAKRIGRLGSFQYDPSTGEFTASTQLRALWGLPADGPVEDLVRGATNPDDAPRAGAAFAAALAQGGRHTWTFRINRLTDGIERHMSSVVEVIHDDAGRPLKVTGAHQDVTELVEAEQRAVRANGLFEAILTVMPDYTFVTDLKTATVVYGSPGKGVLGLTTEQIQDLGAKLVPTLVHPEDQPRLRATNVAAGSLADGELLQIRYRGRHTDGTWRWLSRRVTPFRRDPRSGEVLEVLGVMRDVTDVVQVEERLTHAALHDTLTGLPNRSLMMDRLEGALTRAHQNGRDIAVLFCDLDGFKRVNDIAGHAAGDVVLTETAGRIRRALRQNDTLARVGGDEFVIIVEPWDRETTETTNNSPETLDDRELATALADRIIKAVRQPLTIDGTEHTVSASIGITYAGSTRRSNGLITSNELLQEADAAMYRAKHLGKDRFEVFEHGLRADLVERGRVELVLRRAVAAGLTTRDSHQNSTTEEIFGTPRLEPFYQPIFDLDSGRLVGFEALARLTDTNGLLIPTDILIDVAETTGLIRNLGMLMLDLACTQLATWQQSSNAHRHLTMAVNVSALQASHSFLGNDVRAAIMRHKLQPTNLILEVTETALLQAGPSTLSALQQLHDDGVGIAIDDFGTGYASLRYLATLPITAVKIDRSFTAGLPNDKTSDKIVRAVAGLAADLGLDCVVEGVETLEQQRALPPAVQIQGLLTGRPMPPDDIDLTALATAAIPRQHTPPT
jgi:diguanylate cyclase (GGDEF)-like protein/PAS domain S-box-containing protein